jgi:DNA mismatch repair protein MutS
LIAQNERRVTSSADDVKRSQTLDKEAKVTPMMAQYLAIKKNHPDGLLFYRMGDFYELFFDDAVTAAAALDITLTKRGKHLGDDIPMCGVPVHSHLSYLSRLIRQGFKVAVCEQTEAPAEAKKRGPKAVVRRDVRRIITQGTLTEDALLDARRHNYLAACARIGGKTSASLGLAWVDLSTGAFHTQEVDSESLGAALARLEPGELLISDAFFQDGGLSPAFEDWQERLTALPQRLFDSKNARRRLETFYQVKELDSFGAFSRAEVAAAGALIDYLDLTQKGSMARLDPPRRLTKGASLEIDAATRRSLELVRTLSGERKGSLLGVIDKTLTGAGARMLTTRLAAPLTDCEAINARLDAVQFFVENGSVRDDLRGHLKKTPDMERALSRLSLSRGGPRDLAAICDGLTASARMRDILGAGKEAFGGGVPASIKASVTALGPHQETIDLLSKALAPELPLNARDGGFIATGYAPALDELCTLRDESRRLTANLQSRYLSETNISSLKVRHNNMLGYFVEVSAKQADKMATTEDSPFIHRQTLANAVRYTTVELGDLESRIVRAADQALALELELFSQLSAALLSNASAITEAASAVAALDVASALAQLACDRRYVRPHLEEKPCFVVKGGRHPVVEAALEASQEATFVPNNAALNQGDGDESARLWLLTGPNMAGKSTFLRQNALIVILAQMGSFVPADEARIGIVDKLFSRVGAADDLARGRSTFMVEMVETAAILNQAGEKSLVILDEIGRGTATYDGLSIAWAVVEHLAMVNRCRALFATHYHELTALAETVEGIACHTMKVKEWKEDIVFLHEVTKGAADRSYGIHVGKLAGLPEAVVKRAERVLKHMEQSNRSSDVSQIAESLPLFASLGSQPTQEASPLEEALAEMNADDMSPREALEALYQLKNILDKAL